MSSKIITIIIVSVLFIIFFFTVVLGYRKINVFKSRLFKLKVDDYVIFNTLDIDMKKNSEVDWSRTFNPSIVKLGNDMIVMYRIVSQKISEFSRSSILIGKISNCDIKNNVMLLSKPFKIYKSDKNNISWIYPNGLEDPRIYVFKGSLYCLSTYANGKGENIMTVVKITDNLMTWDRVLEIKPNFDKNSYRQKNWNPFIIKDGKQLFVSHIQPHNIVSIDMYTGEANVLYTSKSNRISEYFNRFGASLRGSTRYLETDFGYLAIAHSVYVIRMIFVGVSVYSHFFYLVEKSPPYRITYFSDLFCISNTSNLDCNNIQFVSGLEKVGNKLWLSYGDDDKESHIAIVDLDYAIHLTKKNIA